MGEHVQFRFDRRDPYQDALYTAWTTLPKGARHIVLIRLCRQVFGPASEVSLRDAMRGMLYGVEPMPADDLEDKQKRRERESTPMGAPPQSKPLQSPPESEPMHKPQPSSEPLERQPRRASVDLASADALEIRPCLPPTPTMDVDPPRS